MRRKRKLLFYLSTGILVAFLASIVPVLAVKYAVGVRVEDWVKYEVSGSWSGTGTEPPWTRYDWVKMIVQSIIGKDISVLANIHNKDGTEENNTLSWNIDQGGEMWIIGSDLEKGDPIATGAEYIINDTITRTYAGASRSVNFLNTSQSFEGSTLLATFYWDQVTGVLLESFANKTSLTENWVAGYRATETNLWPPPTPSPTPTPTPSPTPSPTPTLIPPSPTSSPTPTPTGPTPTPTPTPTGPLPTPAPSPPSGLSIEWIAVIVVIVVVAVIIVVVLWMRKKKRIAH